ncbi:carbohydrate ABC transporter permease [Brachybacterium fresconis]|uniref:ABC-type sugar transport system permease subunit n=1 Tax=Brachybacterium fresconis TaxID=173363 RepID=A0ABS4YNU1_9MICO|nr:sugar ABC transporter permease [Brachybacterium fresconis]MBP2410180.1 ABC-type sugar transport system permease subunit [Brachybacterium fresconis]
MVTTSHAAAPARTGDTSRRPRRRHGLRPRWAPWLFISPAMCLYIVFAFVPIGWMLVLSFQDVAQFGTGEWIGVDNYTRMVQDPLFWQSLKITAIFTVGTVPVSMAIGLALAIALNRPMPGRAILRTAYFLPIVVSGVVTSLIMSWIFNGDYGVINNGLAALGLDRVQWLTSPNLAMVTLILAVVWTRVGLCMVVYLAALQDIPTDLHEAAALDGATTWQAFLRIVLPLLSPTTFLLFVINVIFSLHAFDIIYVMTGGGPGFATTVLLQYIFESAFTNGELGYASALSVVLTIILLLLAVVRRQSERAEGEMAV